MLARLATLSFAMLLLMGSAQAAPNILLILTDDMAPSMEAYLPRTRSLVMDKGAKFTRAYFNDPLCCPSRATMLTGQYVHNTTVWDNEHGEFVAAGLDTETIAVWLAAAGYRTGLIGKYLNSYPTPKPITYVPPSWSFWRAIVGDPPTRYLNHRLVNERGVVTTYGMGAADYVTDVDRRLALDFIRTTPAGQPLFLWLSFVAPHNPYTPAERHKGLFGAVKAPRPPSFNEVDVSDKPSWIRGKARFSSTTLSNIDSRYRNQVRTLAAVDEAIEAIVGQLNASGRLQDTYIIFLQDNGWQAGEHRVAGTKGLPYEESLRASLYVRGPGVAAGSKIDRLAVNADLAPTILDLVGAEPLPRADGRSLVELLRGQTPTTWRNAIPIAFREQSWSWWPSWRGVRTSRYTYVEYEGGERELYDNAADPYQLRSLHGSTAMEPLRSQLASLAGRLNACARAECRAIEAEDVP
jgi:N-acetylglucosamine-6-sulfatase